MISAMGWAIVAAAQSEPTAQGTPPEVSEEIVVYGDPFARWDGTRWSLSTDLLLPYAIPLFSDENFGFRTNALQFLLVLACDKDHKLAQKRFEVSCVLEDVALRANTMPSERGEADLERSAEVLRQLDAKLSGARIQLQVLEDGRVDNVDLEGLVSQNRRINQMNETLRTLLGRSMSGFHLKLQKFNQLQEGKWVEFNSKVLSMPATAEMTPMGSSTTVHYLNQFRGHTIVQTLGKGVVGIGVETSRTYDLELVGVSLFDREEGYMTERVWSVEGRSTAGAFFDDAGYFFAGRIDLLEEAERPDLGPTQLVEGPGQTGTGLPPWVPLER